MAKVALAAFVVIASPDMATAVQTEVDPGRVAWKREGLIRYHERLERRLQAQAAEAVPANTPPAAPSSGPYIGSVLSAEQVAAYARGAGFPEHVIPTMVAIAHRESRFDPSAVNSSSGACGLWQLYPCPGPHALDPATNAALAYDKYAASGLSPWGY